MDEITLPRAVVAALVDPKTRMYARESAAWCDHPLECMYCLVLESWTSHEGPDQFAHEPDCPVRIVQEALAQQEQGT